MIHKVSREWAKNVWIESQKLNLVNPFGQGSSAVSKAVRHLGYVQIDTISVIERSHHHILYNRIPKYKVSDLEKAQSIDKSVFEYWTHALSYVAKDDYKYFVPQMKKTNTTQGSWFGAVTKQDYKKVLNILKSGPVTIRDINDDVLKDKRSDWDSKKPSKRALQMGFYNGDFVISRRRGMLKEYDLTKRHFNWKQSIKACTEKQYTQYLIDRALLSQGLVSLDSICYLNSSAKHEVLKCLNKMTSKDQLSQLQVDQDTKTVYWSRAETMQTKPIKSQLTHILSPFDPLIIQRKRLQNIFDYQHLFEAYVPKAKRQFGYFTLPVLSENNIIALLDLKTDRLQKKLLIQNWIWQDQYKSKSNSILIENELQRFEKFQLGV